MTSGDQGVVIMARVDELGYDVPVGSTIVCLAKPGYPVIGAAEESLLPCTASLDGSTIFYATQGQGLDFQSGGNWITRFRILQPNGDMFTTPPGQFFVYPA